MPVPYVYLYSLQVQNDFCRKNWVATIGYQGSASRDLTRINVKNLAYFYSRCRIRTFSRCLRRRRTRRAANFNGNALNTQLEHRFRRQPDSECSVHLQQINRRDVG